VLRLDIDAERAVPGIDDLEALADAVREAARPSRAVASPPREPDPGEHGRRGHLRVLPAPTSS
jgi:hypothetical protein